MRIISGTAKGAKLFSPSGLDTRPTRDFVKEAVFNIIGEDIAGSIFLDLFSGTGSAGLEAKSRGAAKVYLVDSSKKAVELIKKNALKTKLDVEIILSDAERFLRARNNLGCGLAHSFDIAFLDPPYNYDLIQLAKIISILKSKLNSKIIIAERDKNSPVINGYKKIKTYGKTNIIFY
jgi:16S rRNA (guanine(966)-N(2))-methyltransferase RsmD